MAGQMRLACVAVSLGLLSCGDAGGGDHPLVEQRDSAGVLIVEASRPLWGDSDPERWVLDPDPAVDLTLSGTGPDHEFYRVRGMVLLSDGSVAVADGGSNEVRLYSDGGGFRGSAGGEGEGPGEFDRIWGLQRGRGDTLLALDQSDRVTVFAPDLTFVASSRLAPFSQAIYGLDDGTMVVESQTMSLEIYEGGGLVRRPTVLWRFDPEDARIDSIRETAGTEEHVVVSGEHQGQTGTLFGKGAHIATHGGKIYHGRADAMKVEERTAAGDLVRILRIRDFPLILTAEQIRVERRAMLDEESVSWWRDIVARVPAPPTRPAYDDIIADPTGALWLRPFRGRSELEGPETWQVIATDGMWLGGVEIPENFRVMDIGMDAVLGVRRDALDVEHPQVLRLRRE